MALPGRTAHPEVTDGQPIGEDAASIWSAASCRRTPRAGLWLKSPVVVANLPGQPLADSRLDCQPAHVASLRCVASDPRKTWVLGRLRSGGVVWKGFSGLFDGDSTMRAVASARRFESDKRT